MYKQPTLICSCNWLLINETRIILIYSKLHILTIKSFAMIIIVIFRERKQIAKSVRFIHLNMCRYPINITGLNQECLEQKQAVSLLHCCLLLLTSIRLFVSAVADHLFLWFKKLQFPYIRIIKVVHFAYSIYILNFPLCYSLYLMLFTGNHHDPKEIYIPQACIYMYWICLVGKTAKSK